MDMLKLRNDMKRRKPDFVRQQSGLKKQFKGKWRKPKGLHSKLRLAKKGHGSCPSIGYSSPKVARGLMRDGKKLHVVHNLNDLKNLNEGCVVIGSDVGLKKRIALLDELAKRGLSLINVKDVSKYLEDIKGSVVKRKDERKKKKEKRDKTKEEIKKKKKEKKEEKKEIKEDSKKGEIESKTEVAVGRKEKFSSIRKVTAPKSQ